MILIVDDEVKIANLLRDYLNNSGYTTRLFIMAMKS